MGILLSVQQVDVRIPQFEVSAGAAGHKHLTTGREAAGHDTGLAHCTASVTALEKQIGLNGKVY